MAKLDTKQKVLTAIQDNADNYRSITSEDLKKDKDIVLATLKKSPDILSDMPDEVLKNTELLLEAVKAEKKILKNLPEATLVDKKFMFDLAALPQLDDYLLSESGVVGEVVKIYKDMGIVMALGDSNIVLAYLIWVNKHIDIEEFSKEIGVSIRCAKALIKYARSITSPFTISQNDAAKK